MSRNIQPQIYLVSIFKFLKASKRFNNSVTDQSPSKEDIVEISVDVLRTIRLF